MPTSNSAKKRLKQNIVRRARNRSAKSVLKSLVRKVREATDAKDVAKGEADLRVVARRLDQAASKHVIHRNAASRLKSRLSKGLKTAKQAQQVAGS